MYEMQVVTSRGGDKALAYVWTVDMLKGAPIWTTDSMTAPILENYLETTRAWRAEYEGQTRPSV